MQNFFNFLLHKKWLTLSLSVILVVLAALGAKNLSFSNDYRMFFKPDFPQLQSFQKIQDTYTKTDNVLFILTPDDGDIFTRRNLASVEFLTEAAWQIPYSIRVDSISNFQHTYAEDDDLVVENLIEFSDQYSDEEIARKKAIATSEPLLVRRLVSPSGHVTGINVTIQLPGKHLNEVPEVAAFVRDLARQTEARYPFIKVRLSGLVMMNNSFPEASQQDVKTLYPLMLGLIILILGLLLKSVTATVATLAVVILTIVSTMGLTGWSGIILSPPTTITPVIIMTLAVADCVHILVSYFHYLHKGMTRIPAMLESLRINIGPVFLTSITTAIGFMSFNFGDSPPFRDLGNMAATGVMVAFLLSVIFMPAFMLMLPHKPRQIPENENRQFFNDFAEFVLSHRQGIFWGMVLLSLFLVSQIMRNELNDEFVKYFDETVSFRVDTDYSSKNLTGIYLIEYSLESGESGGINDPEYMRNLEKFAQWYRSQPRVLHVNTLSDVMKRLNKNMHNDDPQWYRLPDSRELTAQYLLLYEMSLPFGLDLNNQINVKKSATRLTVTFENLSTREVLDMAEKARVWMEHNLPPVMRAEGTSPTIMFAHLGQENIKSMLKGTAIALVIISFLLVFALKSWRIGLLSLVPNLIPALMAFGLWGMLVGQVGLALSVVTGMTLGIVVDDTIHFLSKYLRARREMGLNPDDAIRYAFSTVGKALFVTSVVLVIGFCVLAFSHFELNSGMGLLTAITITIALIADFFLLPTLLLKFERKSHV